VLCKRVTAAFETFITISHPEPATGSPALQLQTTACSTGQQPRSAPALLSHPQRSTARPAPAYTVSHNPVRREAGYLDATARYSSLANDRGRESTAESTPISTPVELSVAELYPLLFSWHRKLHELIPCDLQLEPDLLVDCSFLLFPSSAAPRHTHLRDMAQAASPINIATPPRFGSNSPQNQTSNLTPSIQQKGHEFQRPSLGARNDSINALGGSYGSSARPISMKDRPRRESNTMNSLVNGPSWGGVSVGSWIRGDILMTGTSLVAFNNQSPSYHSPSYLPKRDANSMKDCACCGLTLALLHHLLQHFEEMHAGAPASRTSQAGQGGLPPSTGASSAGMTPSQRQRQGEPATNTLFGFHSRSGSVGGFRPQRLGSDGFSRTNLSTVQDMDDNMDSDMDDIGNGRDTIEEGPNGFSSQQSQFNQNQAQLKPLNINMANTMQNHQGLRTSNPSTPSASQQFNLPNNPTVSSVNTPRLSTVPMTHNLTSPESSHPSTPAELDTDFVDGFNQPMMGITGMDMGSGNTGFNTRMPGCDGTTDQPGKRLLSKQGSGLSQQQLQAAFKNHQMSNGDQTNLAKRLREQALMNGANVPQFPSPEEHGHQNQQLKENEDGTFSIVDPLTSIPYLGTVGMEKEKPYRCERCVKRYKNLNGLKYHRAHSPKCNPELLCAQASRLPALQGLNVGANVAGGGTTGMDNSMF
ncbi:C2H2 transcription factor, partial [Paraphaeosphaeria sporulosa]